MNLDRKQLALLTAAAILIGVGLVLGLRNRTAPPSGAPDQVGTAENPVDTGVRYQETVPPSARAEVAANVTVPDKGSDTPAGVAAPTLVAPASPSGSASLRSFDIAFKGGKFSPGSVIVRKGDTVHINLTATDAAVDFTQPDYGIYVPVPRGQTKAIEFNGNTHGDFTFYCKTCGGPENGPAGHIIIVPN